MKKRVSLQQSTPKTNISKCRVVDILYLLSCFISKYSCLRSHELLHCVVLVGLWRDKGSRQLLFLRNSNFITMPKTDEFRVKSNNSTLTSTSGNTKVAISPFNIKNISSFLEKRKCVVSLQCKYAKPAKYAIRKGLFYVLRLPIVLHIGVLFSRGCSYESMCIGFGDLERQRPFFLYNVLISSMPNPMKLEQKRSTVTSTSTSGGTKTAISPFDIKNISSFLEKRKCVVSLQCSIYRKAEMSANYFVGFFMSATKHIRFHAPVSMVNALTAFRCRATGQCETVLLFIQQFYKQTF